MKPLKHKEPGLAQLILTAGSGVSLGALAACAYLLATPAVRLAQAPEADAPDPPGKLAASYLPGGSALVDSPTFGSRLARVDRRTAGPVTFSEEEINRYISQQRAAMEKAPAEGEEAEKGAAKLETINVRLDGDRMVWNIKTILNPTADPFELLAQIQARFENAPAGPELVVESLRINALPVPTLGGLATSVIVAKLAQVPWSDDLLRKWENIREMSVEEGALVVVVGPRTP